MMNYSNIIISLLLSLLVLGLTLSLQYLIISQHLMNAYSMAGNNLCVATIFLHGGDSGIEVFDYLLMVRVSFAHADPQFGVSSTLIFSIPAGMWAFSS